MFLTIVRESILLVVLISGVPLLVGSAVGLIVSTLQGITQIQEQTVSYFAKFISIGAALTLLSNWYSRELLTLFNDALQSVVMIGSMP